MIVVLSRFMLIRLSYNSMNGEGVDLLGYLGNHSPSKTSE